MLTEGLLIIVSLSIFFTYNYYFNNKKQDKNSKFEIVHYNLKKDVSEMFKEQLTYRKNINEHMKNYNKVLENINKNNHYLLWSLNNNLNIKTFDLIIYILDINTKNTSLEHIIKFCNKIKVDLYIISESHPNEFIDKVLINNAEIKFNINNYLSPYHFKYTFFGYLDKLTTFSNNKLNITIDDMLNYIKNNGMYNYLILTNSNINIENCIYIE